MVTPQSRLAGVSRGLLGPGVDLPIKGWEIAQPVLPGSGTAWVNPHPFPVHVYITGIGSGVTAYKITDPSGGTGPGVITTTVAVGWHFTLEPGASITLTYTGAPTWYVYGYQPGGF